MPGGVSLILDAFLKRKRPNPAECCMRWAFMGSFEHSNREFLAMSTCRGMTVFVIHKGSIRGPWRLPGVPGASTGSLRDVPGESQGRALGSQGRAWGSQERPQGFQGRAQASQGRPRGSQGRTPGDPRGPMGARGTSRAFPGSFS